MNNTGAGVDVSKAYLDVAVHGQRSIQRFTNDAAGFERAAIWLKGFDLTQVILEATGGYEQAALDALHTAGLPVARVNPRQARDFAKASGQLAKTDRLDARVLAHMASVMPQIVYQPLDDRTGPVRNFVCEPVDVINRSA